MIPQETDPDLPMSIQESLEEAWVGDGLLQGWGHYTQCPQPCIRPPPTHTSAGDSWSLPGKSGPVSCGVTLSFSSVLVHTRFSLCLPRVYFPVLCKFWQLYGGVNGNLLQ